MFKLQHHLVDFEYIWYGRSTLNIAQQMFFQFVHQNPPALYKDVNCVCFLLGN